jgi:hypothetical protein
MLRVKTTIRDLLARVANGETPIPRELVR